MAKIKKVANGEYIGANKYTIKDAGGGKSTVDFAPDSVLTPGTEVGAELLNEMQLNALYTLDTNMVVEGQKEVYVANLEGFTDFTKPDLSFYLKINANNTNTQTYLRIDTTDYLIKCKINDLTKNSIVACRKVGSEIIVLNNYMQRQDDAIWGGLDGGGLIEDPSVTKVVGKRYIGADGKAYICLKPSNINNLDNYTPCNVVDNLGKLQNLIQIKPRNYLVGNICFEYFTFSGGAGLYTKSLVNNFKEIIFVGFNGLTNEDQVNPEFSQHWLVYSYNEIASKKAIKLRKMSTQSIEGIIIGLI